MSTNKPAKIVSEAEIENATLDAIGLKNGTDKASSGHGYLSFYDSLFSGLRTQDITLLEIGVFRGSSIITWEEYFPKGKIIGADINPATKSLERGRIIVELIDQSNIQHLVDIAVKHGPFDIIIEDGSHLWEHQKTTLLTLFPFVKDGGFYVVEDLQTNYGSLSNEYKGVASESCAEYLKKWADLTIAEEQINLNEIEDPFLRTYGNMAYYITFYRHMVAIKKKPGQKILSPSFPPISKDVNEDLEIKVLGHYGIIGDLSLEKNWINIIPDHKLQGVSIEASIGDLFEYRSKIENCEWGQWVTTGSFSGSRGEGRNITGFSINLKDHYKSKYLLTLFCRFFGSNKVFESNGTCESSDGSALSGIQVNIKSR